MVTTAYPKVKRLVPQNLTPEQEDARLDAFFLHIGSGEDPPFFAEATKLHIENGGTARKAWTLNNRARGGTEAFLRATWVDRSRAIISFGYTDGLGRADIWKARFGDDDRAEETEFLGSQQGSGVIGRDEALVWWYFGAGVLA